MRNLEKDYPNVCENMPEEWLTRFKQSDKIKEVERLFNYLESKYIEKYKTINPLTEKLAYNIYIYIYIFQLKIGLIIS